MFGTIYEILFYAIPAALIILFLVVRNRYKSAKKQNEQVPGTFSDEEIKRRKIVMIIVGVIGGAIITVVVGFTALLFLAVAFM